LGAPGKALEHIYATVALTIVSGVHYVLRLALICVSAGNKADSSEPASNA